MKTENITPSATTNSTPSRDDSGKLVSLLALAAGAVAMPQTSIADIIYTDLSANPAKVGYASGYSDSFQFTLPGTAQFGFQRRERTETTTFISIYQTKFRTAFAGRLGGAAQAGLQATANGFVPPLPFGAAWNQGLGLFYTAPVGVATTNQHVPSSGFDHKYVAWLFSNTAQSGATRYGWAEVSLSIGNYPGGPNVTIYGYAFDSTGAQPTMGQMPVPEPSSLGLMVLGALTLGAKGLRSWRRDRVAARTP